MQQGTAVNVDAIEFPALLLHPRYGYVALSAERVTHTTRHGLSHGEYDGLLIVSRSGHAYAVAGARKVGTVGPFGGWNLFLNQRIRIELIAGAEPYRIGVEDLRSRVFESFRTWHGWESAENFEEIEARVRRATTPREIIDALS
jgi:hypothetical protein